MGNKEDVARVAQSVCNAKGFGLVCHLAGGAFKSVFHVQAASGEDLALKVVRGPSASPRTQREIRALERCQHDAVAQILSMGHQEVGGDRYDYIVEEFLPGGTLTDQVSDRLVDKERTLAIGEAIIDVLGHLESRGLVHRDIKPDNIMFREDMSTPVLVDFGLVRDLRATSLTETWARRGPGTPYYASPEQLNNDKALIDWRTDQYCLGATLACAHLGVHPYQHAGEPSFCGATVERAACRGTHGSQFTEKAHAAGLPCLVQMTAGWPVQRFSTPRELHEAWRAQ